MFLLIILVLYAGQSARFFLKDSFKSRKLFIFLSKLSINDCESFRLPNKYWSWVDSEWILVPSESVENPEEGWRYAKKFGSDFIEEKGTHLCLLSDLCLLLV